MRRLGAFIQGTLVSGLALLFLVTPGLSQPPSPALSDEPRTRPLLLPLPAFGSSPNKGNDFGFLPVWLFFDPEGKINNIFAPSAIYNTDTGLKGALRWIGYLPASSKFRLIAIRSTKVDEDYLAEFEAPYYSEGRYALYGRFRYFRDPTFRFFGFGPRSREEDESGLTQRELNVAFSLGVNFLPPWRITYDERVRLVTIEAGGRTTEAFIGESFPGTPGVGGDVFVSARGFTLTYDSRDFTELPTRGLFGKASVEVSSDLWGSETSYTRFTLEGRLFIPWPDDRWVTALRLATSLLDTHGVPFFEQSRLGGKDFRAFPDDRFVDRGSFLFNVEERHRLLRRAIFRVETDLELAPFIEVGQVFGSAPDIATERLRVAFGMGFRAVARPNVVGKIDVGFGEEGTRLFVGLGYPF